MQLLLIFSMMLDKSHNCLLWDVYWGTNDTTTPTTAVYESQRKSKPKLKHRLLWFRQVCPSGHMVESTIRTAGCFLCVFFYFGLQFCGMEIFIEFTTRFSQPNIVGRKRSYFFMNERGKSLRPKVHSSLSMTYVCQHHSCFTDWQTCSQTFSTTRNMWWLQSKV